MFDESEEPHVLVCSEILGGNRKFIGTTKLPGMVAWVATFPIDEKRPGGDLHLMSACDYDLISRVVLADVSGHGQEVEGATTALLKLMRANINVWDQSDFMRGLNDSFNRRGDGRYATAIVVSFHRVTGRLAFSNAGHLPPLWYHAVENVWEWLEESDPIPRMAFGLPVGLISGTDYRQTIVAMNRSDLLLLYTDGVTDAEDETGKDLGREQLLEWVSGGPAGGAPLVGRHLLRKLMEFRASVQCDDETLMVLQRE